MRFFIIYLRQKMQKLLIFLAILVAFSACNTASKISNAENKELLAYTTKLQKGEFLVVGAYINPIYDKQKGIENEYFVLSVLPSDSQILAHTISVNNESDGTSLKELDANDEMLNNINFKVPWAKYYLITAPSKKADVLSLSFEAKFKSAQDGDLNASLSENYQNLLVSLSFQKIAKSLYWNPK